MATSSVSLVAEALKLFYTAGLQVQINEKASPFCAEIEKTTEGVTGSKIRMGLQYGRHGGVGNAADDGDLPAANARKLKAAEWETKNIFARFRLTQKVIDASKGDRGAFVNLLTNEVETLEIDAKDNFSRQALGNGTGVLCTISGAKTSLTVPVDSTDFVAEGMLVDILDATDGTTMLNTSSEITAVDDDGLTITLDVVGTVASGDTVYIHGSKGLELTGVRSVFESATVYGITIASSLWFKPNRINLAGELSEIDIQKAIQLSDRKAGSTTGFITCSYGVQRAYLAYMGATKSIVNSIDIKGGFKAPTFNGIPVAADKYVASGKLYALDMKDWKMYQMADWSWLDQDGAMLSRVPDKAAYEATLYKFADIGCRKPKGQTEIYGIIEH
jgi:hypothetical protein